MKRYIFPPLNCSEFLSLIKRNGYYGSQSGILPMFYFSSTGTFLLRRLSLPSNVSNFFSLSYRRLLLMAPSVLVVNTDSSVKFACENKVQKLTSHIVMQTSPFRNSEWVLSSLFFSPISHFESFSSNEHDHSRNKQLWLWVYINAPM